MSTETPAPKPVLVTKFVRHDFTNEEKIQLGSELARSHSALRGLEAEFDQLKASHKAKLTSHEAKIDCLGTDIQNGFDMRNKECRTVYDLPKKRRLYFLADAPEDAKPVAEEPMEAGDFQDELFRAESKFGHRSEIILFHAAGKDKGILVVGELKERWYSALRIQIGTNRIDERLDSEQKSCKARFDAIKTATKRAEVWISDAMGQQVWKGFSEKVKAAEEAEKERVE